MRIGIDVMTARLQGAGVSRYARGVLGALADMDTRDWFMTVSPRLNHNGPLAPLPPFAHGRHIELPISAYHFRRAWLRWGLTVPPDLLAPRLDVFYTPDWPLLPLAYAKGVCTIHDLAFMIVPEIYNSALLAELTRGVPRMIERARLVITDVEHTKRDLVRLLNVPPERIRVAGCAADPLFRPISDRAWRAAEQARLGLPDHFLLSVGTLQPNKNLVRLVEALALLRGQGWALPLFIAGGEGWLYEPMYKRVADLGLQGLVHFMGRVTDADLLALYNLTDVMVFPSLYEGFGLPPLEALACGVTVVCSNTSSLPEVVGDAAVLVDPYDSDALAQAIDRATHDNRLRHDLAERSLAQAGRFSWPKVAQTVLSTLREAAS